VSDDIHDDLHYVSFRNDIDASNLLEKPSMSQYFDDQSEKFNNRIDLESKIKSQYCDLDLLGIDFISNNEDLVSNDFLIEFLDYINNNIFSITYIDIIYDDDVRLRNLGFQIYKILYVDFVNETCKFLCKKLEVNSIEDILSFSNNNIRNNLIAIYTDLLNSASDLAKINKNINSSVVKFGQAIDLFDNDVTDFRINFLIPVLEKYSIFINSQLIL
jgi:hypothetical protein